LPLPVSAFHSLPIKAFLPRPVTAVQPQRQLMFFKLWQFAAMLLPDFLSIKSLTTELSGGRLNAMQQLKALHTAHPESCKMPCSSPSA